MPYPRPYPNKPLYSVIQHQQKLILEVPNSVRDCCFQHCYSNRAMVLHKL